jgi:hypothetical protein
MYDAVIFAEADPEPAARTLACLVEGAVEGLLNHVLVISATQSEELAALADAAGCRVELGVTGDRLPEALKRHLVTTHTLAFAAGALPPAGWPARLRDEFRKRGEPDPEMALLFRPERRREAWKLIAKVSLRGRMPLAHGALVPRFLLPGYRAGSIKSHGPMHISEMTVGRL